MDSLESSPALLDEEGRLFGLMNIVDALVVLLVLGVVAASGAFVIGGGSGADDTALNTTYATVDLGVQPDYVVSALNEGDSYQPDGTSNITVTDVYLSPQNNETRVVIRTALRGTNGEGGFIYADAPPQLGRTVAISTERYNVSGQIPAVGTQNTLDRSNTTVVVRGTMSSAAANEIAPGDEIAIAGRSVATVEDVAVYPTSDAGRHTVFTELQLETYVVDGTQQFGGTPVRSGQQISLSADAYDVNGEIRQIGSGLEQASTDILLEDTVSAETAERLAAGDVVTVAGYETAEVRSVTVYGTANPDRRRVFVGLTLGTVETGGIQQFGRVSVQEGRTINITADSYELSGPIRRVGALSQRGAVTSRTVTLQLSEVSEATAATLQPGMAEINNGEQIATVTAVSREPSTILATAENGSVVATDHPTLRDVTLTTELRVRETTNGVNFKGETIQQGSTVTLNLGLITVTADVVSLGG